MVYILAVTENIVILFFLLFTVSFSHKAEKERKEAFHILRRICAFMAVFFLFNQTLQRILPLWMKPFFLVPPCLTFLLGTVYIFLFFRKEFLSCLVMFISHMLCLLSLRGFFSVVIDSLVEFFNLANVREYLFFVCYYIFSAVFSLSFLQRPLKFVSELPQKLILCMFLSPMCMFILTEFFVDLAQSNSSFYRVSLFFFVLLMLTTILIYYLFYTVTETYHKKIQSELIQQRLALQLNHVERSMGMVEQIRRDKHEMKNVYFYIQSLIKSGELKELEEFVDTKLVPRYDHLEEFQTGN